MEADLLFRREKVPPRDITGKLKKPNSWPVPQLRSNLLIPGIEESCYKKISEDFHDASTWGHIPSISLLLAACFSCPNIKPGIDLQQ